MGRLIRYGRAFRSAYERAGLAPGTPLGKSVAATVRAIGEAHSLPGPGDAFTMLPPASADTWVRRVHGANLWIYFQVAEDGSVFIVSVVTSPPPVYD